MRSVILDQLRGLAVLWMIIFHFFYDLNLLGFINWNFSTGFWYGFPRLIAFTFLFCVGASMSFQPLGLNSKKFWKRWTQITLSAFIISLSTYIFFRQSWIYFGTLHCIASGILITQLFRPFKKTMSLVVVIILILQYVLNYDINWVSSFTPHISMDFIPLYPWIWVIFLGNLTSPYWCHHPILNRTKTRLLQFLGNNSLIIYLIHQPILWGILLLIQMLLKHRAN